MAFCIKCGKELQSFSAFCIHCGARVGMPEIKPVPECSTIVVKYEKNPLAIILTEPLNVTLDGQLSFRVPEGRDISYNVENGTHTLTAFVPYFRGSKYGETAQNFQIGPNQVLEVLYKPPAAVFLSGNISIRKVM